MIVNEEDFKEYLEHYGVPGMKRGVRRSNRSLRREARRDARNYATTRTAYGTGAGLLRRRFDAQMKVKLQNPVYKKHYTEAVQSVDYIRAQKRADRWRRGKDVQSQATRSAKAAAKFLTGTTSLAAIGILYVTNKPAVDAFIAKTLNKFK